MSEPLYLLDGYSVIYRSYFALMRSPLRNSRGENTSAIFGFLRTLITLFRDYQPTHFVVVLDAPGPTFRHDTYKEYKATRDKTPDDLHAQIPVIQELLQLLKVPSVQISGYEADDLMATLAKQCDANGMGCRVISADKDLLQLVQGQTTVLRPGKNGIEELHREEVFRDWGVWPEQILDYLSIVGDASDNVPGIAGIGAKGAVKLLSQYGSLEEIYRQIDSVTPPGTQKKLREGEASAWLSRDLITLADDAPLTDPIDSYTISQLDYQSAASLIAEQGMHRLLAEVGVSTEGLSPSIATTSPAAAGDTTFSPLLFPRDRAAAVLSPEEQTAFQAPGTTVLITTIAELEDLSAHIRTAGVVALDCETDMLDPREARPVGFSLAWTPDTGYYLPLFGPDGPVIPEEPLKALFRDLFTTGTCRVVGQNFKYDWQILHRWGVTLPPEAIANDTMIAAWLVDTTASAYGMDRLAEQYLQYTTIHFSSLFADSPLPKEQWSFQQVPLSDAATYAGEDAFVTWRLHVLLDRLVDRRNVREVLETLELPLIPILGAMELEGIGLDTTVLEQFSRELDERITTLQSGIFETVGHEFNINSTRQLQDVLFTERKLQPIKKTRTGYSTDTSVLQELAREDPVVQHILEYRTLAKLRSTWVEALPKLVNTRTKRIHTSLNQTGTATERLSSTDPNLQNIPIREGEGRRIRDAFVPNQGNVFVSADYAQVELVILAHLSGDPALSAAFREGEDVHRRTASLIFQTAPEDVTAEQRRIAKTINFGVMYGMSAFRLSNELGIPRGEAQQFITAYFSTYNGIQTFIDDTVARAEADQEVRTLSGRPRPLPDINNRNRTIKAAAQRVAVNTPIQGTGADIIKRAMLEVDRRLRESSLTARLILQVHDELILECPRDEVGAVKALVMEAMSTAVQLSVPLRVGVESGDRWGAMH